jgi:hypothetical protein
MLKVQGWLQGNLYMIAVSTAWWWGCIYIIAVSEGLVARLHVNNCCECSPADELHVFNWCEYSLVTKLHVLYLLYIWGLIRKKSAGWNNWNMIQIEDENIGYSCSLCDYSWGAISPISCSATRCCPITVSFTTPYSQNYDGGAHFHRHASKG